MNKIALKTEEHMSFKNLRFLKCVEKLYALPICERIKGVILLQDIKS